MLKPKALVTYGLGIGCHEEVAHAYRQAGAEADLIHLNDLLETFPQALKKYKIINFTGGFLHGDILGSGMCAANLLEHAEVNSTKFQDLLWEFASRGNIIYGQCNGFQLLVKSGLLPAIDNKYKDITVSLAHNECGSYRVDYVPHIVKSEHFAFAGMKDQVFYLWCRHGEGRITFGEKDSVSAGRAEQIRARVLKENAFLFYANPKDSSVTNSFPICPNGSADGIAGMTACGGRIIGHMAHPEVSVHTSRRPDYYKLKEAAKRKGEDLPDYQIGLKIFKNIVGAV